MFIYEQNKELKIAFNSNKPTDNAITLSVDSDKGTMFLNNSEVAPVVGTELSEDVTFTTAKVISGPETVVLNGHKISAPEDTAGDGVYHVVEGGYLTIDGEGVVDGVSNNDYNMAIWADGGHVVINGGTFTNKGATATLDPAHFDLIYAKNGGIVEINGGRFECETPQWTLNNNDKAPGNFIVRGGTFVGFDPSCTETEPAGANNNFVAEGYKVVVSGNEYTVIKK